MSPLNASFASVQGTYPELEECNHILGGATWGTEEGAAFGDDAGTSSGGSSKSAVGKKPSGFGDGPLPPPPLVLSGHAASLTPY